MEGAVSMVSTRMNVSVPQVGLVLTVGQVSLFLDKFVFYLLIQVFLIKNRTEIHIVKVHILCVGLQITQNKNV